MTDTKQQTTDIKLGFHLTVNRHGVISLWDRAEQARGTLDEEYTILALTDMQRVVIQQAIRKANERYLAEFAASGGPQIGKVIDLHGYDELAHITGLGDDDDSFKIVHNNSDHVLVARECAGGMPDRWILAASFSYLNSPFNVTYAHALAFALGAVGAVVVIEKPKP